MGTDEGSSPDTSGEAKRAANQVTFRETNEQIRDVVDKPDFVLPVVPFVCECADPACRRLLSVSLPVYADVRSSPRHFIHAIDHIDDGTSGTVVARQDGYAVIEKTGVSARVAEHAEGEGE